MIHSNLLFECKSIKYLTSNIIAVTGNSSLGHLEILQVNDENENSNKQEFASSGSFRNLSELEFPSSVLTNMEICGIANQARTLIATSNIDFKTKQGYICLTNAQLSSDSCPLEVASTLVSNDPISKFTSLSFHLHQTHLAAASSIGDVSVFDILSEQQTMTFPADSCGVNQVLYTRTGQLLTAGSSNASQLRLWDGRVGFNAVQVRSFSHPTDGCRLFPTYSSMTLHPSLPVVYCGTCNGDVIEWDLRFESGKQDSSIATQSLFPHMGRVTSLAYHPSKDALLSSGVDGTLKESQLSTSFKSEKTLIDEAYPCAIASMDVHADYGTLAAASSTGSIWQIVL